jgi:hypothetical protein
MSILRDWIWADGKSHLAPGRSFETPCPSTRPDSDISISPRTRQSLVHEPPTWYVCFERLVIVTDQRTRSPLEALGPGVGLGITPGSE